MKNNPDRYTPQAGQEAVNVTLDTRRRLPRQGFQVGPIGHRTPVDCRNCQPGDAQSCTTLMTLGDLTRREMQQCGLCAQDIEINPQSSL